MAEGGAKLSVVFWNIWSDNQWNESRLKLLLETFQKIIDKYNPDFFGLNEVLVDMDGGFSAVLKFLEEKGYKTHFSSFAPETSRLLAGSAIATRINPIAIREHVLGPDKYGARHGFPGHTVKMIETDLNIKGLAHPIKIFVNYLAHLAPYNLRTHRLHWRTFKSMVLGMKDYERSMAIIGGDFNQFKFLPTFRQLTQFFWRATGTFWRPTWQWSGKGRRIVRANYDNILWSKNSPLHLEKFKVLPRFPSDHAPLLAEFKISDLQN